MLATHDAELEPSLDGYVVLHTGPVLPDLRQPSGSRIGVDITLGKTDATSVDELLQRYAFIASQPEGQIAKVREALGDMAVSRAAARRPRRPGAARRLVAGRRAAARRAAPAARAGSRLLEVAWCSRSRRCCGGSRGTAASPSVVEGQEWKPLAEFLGPEVPLPDEVRDLEVRGDVTTEQTGG